jgi:hypothetical protein
LTWKVLVEIYMGKDVNVGQNCVGHAVVVRSYRVNFREM